ncbi:MAG: hypothetical protein GY853_09945 [PVC group bacterium]|nr:hypothetical protein [PVC group bacterium]
MLEEKDSTINELTENYDKAIKVADELKEKLNKVSSFIEQVVEAEEDFDSEVFVENYKTLKEDHEKVMAMFETDNFKKYEIDKLNDFVELVEDTIKRDTDIEDLKSNENDENLQEKLDVAENHIEECETKLKELGYEFEEAKVKEEDDEEEKDKEKKAGEKEADQEMKDEDDEEVSEKKEKKKEKKESKDPEVVKYVFDSDNKQKLSEKVDDEDDDEDELEEEKNNKITEEINSFFKGQTKKYPGLKDFKKEILGSKSLIEAVNKIDELKEEINEMVDFKITKKTKIKPDWFPKGRI